MIKNARILVAEDNMLNQLVLRKYLEKWEVQFEIVDNGSKACDLLIKKDFDIILMDLQMPVMDGYDAALHIRQLPVEKYRNIPIVALTASDAIEIKQKIASCGINDFLIKPINPEDLHSKISKFLSEK